MPEYYMGLKKVLQNRNSCIMDSGNVNALINLLGTLLMSGFILISITPGVSSDYTADGQDDLYMSTPEECARQCCKGEPPKLCYYHFTMEIYSVLGGACSLCTPNDTNSISSNCQCVPADGVERSLLTVNRMLPGPSIHVCKGDKVVIDVENRMEGMETTIHWHGILQKGSQYYDGVPQVTQCAIPHATTFRYQWHAKDEGTHFWHAHDGMQKMDGIHGRLVVRVPPCEDPNSDLYDYDSFDHEILIADWMHDYAIEHSPGLLNSRTGQLPESALINGKGRYKDPNTGETTNTSLAEFTIKSGHRYRFRIVNSFCSVCPAELIFEGHTLTLISVDGVPVEPVKINTIISFPGERFDVVINADQPPRNYWIQLRALGACAAAEVQQFAILRYSHADQFSSPQPTYHLSLPNGIVLSPLDGICNVTRPDAVCFNQLRSARPVNRKILKKKPDFQFYLGAEFFLYSIEKLFKPNTYQHFFVPGGPFTSTALINNISYIASPSPPLSQIKDIPPKTFCNKDHLPVDCGMPCMCTHKIDVPLNSVVELCIADGLGIPTLSHPFHLHGYAYNVISMGKSPYPNVKRMNATYARHLDKNGLIHRRFDRPPFKDTTPIPTGGYIVLRFFTDNPGYWLLHCHFLFHHLAGMELVIHVGDDDKDLPPVPPNFPVCGNHLPPIFLDKY